ncbi:hypothetical protein [Roseobacter weihaiensis]|uniref:hypothetical protein n=1 Tax=Roseobacter weihaiensis TaxID=2763262 RepID=UPI001D0A7D7F|nr:hypothetical protein [Roseobacter sp. H9]
MSGADHIYPGGFDQLMRDFERRCRSFKQVDAVIPPADIDLDALHQEKLPQLAQPGAEGSPRYAQAKWARLHAELEGESALFLLHAMLIAILRRRDPPAEAVTLFIRVWREKGDAMAGELPVRWLISAATTFADHGANGDQRALGMGLSLLFDLIKLHDSERRLTGKPGNELFRRRRSRVRPSLAFDMAPYAIRGGDLDRNMLARLWRLSRQDTTIRPLGKRMLEMVMTDNRSIFARTQRLKGPKPQ